MASVLRDHIGDAAGAVDALAPIIDRVGTIEELGLVASYHKSAEDWSGYVVSLEAEARVSPAPRAAELYLEMARIQQGVLDDPEAALGSLNASMVLEPENAAAHHALSSLGEATGDWESVARSLTGSIRLAAGGEERAALLVRLAQVYDVHLNSSALAQEAFEAALNQAPEHLDTLGAAASFHMEASEWRVAERLLDRMLRQSSNLAKGRHAELRFARARCARELGNSRSAKEHLLATLEVDEAHAGALGSLRDLAIEAKLWGDATTYGMAYLEAHGAQLPAEQRAQSYYQLGAGQVLLGAREEARRLFALCLKYDPTHEAARRSLDEAVSVAPPVVAPVTGQYEIDREMLTSVPGRSQQPDDILVIEDHSVLRVSDFEENDDSEFISIEVDDESVLDVAVANEPAAFEDGLLDEALLIEVDEASVIATGEDPANEPPEFAEPPPIPSAQKERTAVVGLRERARMEENLRERAILWHQLLTENPQDEEALRALIEDAELRQDEAEQVWLMEQLSAVTESADDRYRVLVKRAERLLLEDPAEAERLVRAACELPLDAVTEAERLVAEACLAQGKYGEWSAELLGALERSNTLASLDQVRIEMVTTLAGQVDSEAAAIDLLKAILVDAPGHAWALDTLKALTDRLSSWEDFLEFLESLLEEG